MIFKNLPTPSETAIVFKGSFAPFIQKMSALIGTFFLKKYLTIQSVRCHRLIRLTAAGLYGYSLIDPSFAGLADGGMKTAVVELQQEILGSGWITVGKIAAAAVGAVMAIARSSAVPFAMGGAVSGGLHFFQKHTEAAAACLL